MWEDSNVCSNYVNEYWGEYHKLDAFCMLPQDSIRGGSCPTDRCGAKTKEAEKEENKEDWTPGTHSRTAIAMLLIIIGMGCPMVCICGGMLIQSIRERKQFAHDKEYEKRGLKDGMEPSADIIGGQYNYIAAIRPPPLHGPTTGSTPKQVVAPTPYVGSLQAGKGFALPRPPPRPPPKLPSNFQSRVVQEYQKSVPSSGAPKSLPGPRLLAPRSPVGVESPALPPHPPVKFDDPVPPPGSPLRLPGFGASPPPPLPKDSEKPMPPPFSPPSALAELRIPPRLNADSARPPDSAGPPAPETPTTAHEEFKFQLPPRPPMDSGGGPPAPPGSPPKAMAEFGFSGSLSAPPPPPGSPGHGAFGSEPPAPPGSPPAGHPVFGMLG